MGSNIEKEVELCPSAKVLYEALKNAATGQDSEDLSFIVGAHRTVVRVLDGQSTTPAVKDARRKAEDAFAACLRAYGDRLLADPDVDAIKDASEKNAKARDYFSGMSPSAKDRVRCLYAVAETVSRPKSADITPGKLYRAFTPVWSEGEEEYLIKDDFGEEVIIRKHNCPTIGGHNWVIAVSPTSGDPA